MVAQSLLTLSRIYSYEELSSSLLNIYTGGGTEDCHFLTPQVVSGTVEIINEDPTVINFDLQTNKDFDVVGSYKGIVLPGTNNTGSLRLFAY